MSAPVAKTLFLLAATAVLASAPAWAADSDAALTTKLVGLTQQLMDALVPGNAEPWRRILADDAVVVDEFGRIQDKADAVASVHPFPPGLSGRIEIRDPRLHRDGDTAVLQGEMYEQETVFGQKLVVRYVFCNTFVRHGADWKLLAANDVTRPTEPPALAVRDLDLGDYPGVYRYGPGRAFTVAIANGALAYTTHAGGGSTALEPLAKDVFMSGGDERNLVIFRRDATGRVVELIERRKFNDLHMRRGVAASVGPAKAGT